MQRLALVTGGNRGLGLETCRQLAKAGYFVILTSRDEQQGQLQAKQLQGEGRSIEAMDLDVSDERSITALYQRIESQWGRLDVLINNAAILLDHEASKEAGEESVKQHRRLLEKTLRTNVVGPYELCSYFAPLMLKNNYGRIVNVSSSLGQLSRPHSDYASYSISKAALNMVTCLFADQCKGTNILVNSVCPGWVKTDMGGPGATRSVEEGARGIVWAATLPDQGPTGGFFRDGQPMDW